MRFDQPKEVRMHPKQHWPERLWLVRHGQSQGNVARDAAHEAGRAVIDLDIRDVDVPLSELGRKQAEAAGRWFAALPESEKPEVLLSSPYIRSRETAEAICEAGGLLAVPSRRSSTNGSASANSAYSMA
jgi:broad specificity phosphatase PhoE